MASAKTIPISIRMTVEEAEQVKRLATAEGRSVSSWIKRAIGLNVKSNGKNAVEEAERQKIPKASPEMEDEPEALPPLPAKRTCHICHREMNDLNQCLGCGQPSPFCSCKDES